jgi:hypothetical protein
MVTSIYKPSSYSDGTKASPRASRRRTNSPGVVPSIRRQVRVRCAASENPAECAASVMLAPRIKSPEARCSLSHNM